MSDPEAYKFSWVVNKKPGTSRGRFRNLLIKGLPDICPACDQVHPLNQRIHNLLLRVRTRANKMDFILIAGQGQLQFNLLTKYLHV